MFPLGGHLYELDDLATDIMTGSAPIPWRHLFQTTRSYMPLWAGATIVFTLLGYGYTGVRKAKYSASQSLMVRNEANGEEDRLGRFASQTELKAAQETILQLAQSRDVIVAALKKLGQPQSDDNEGPAESWPSPGDVAVVKGQVSVRPPKGSEFGATEVIVLETKQGSTERARLLCEHVRDALTDSMRRLRTERSTSVINELTQTRNLAKRKRDEANVALQAMESSVGGDLGDLRALVETYAGTGNSQRVLSEVEKELQKAELDFDKLSELENVLKQGQQDPDNLLVTGSELLASQPTLKRLKDGLIDAQLKASQLSSLYTEDHPKMRAAEASQLEILNKIQLEITASIESMGPELRVAADKVNRLKAKREKLTRRMNELAEMRVAYSNLLANFKHRTDLLEKAEATLAEAEATHQAAMSTDLLTPLGPIQVGAKPIGPNDTTLLVGSIVAGLLSGFGMVFLVAPGQSQNNFGRRWSDYSGSNLNTGRPNDPSPPEPAEVTEVVAREASDSQEAVPSEERASSDEAVPSEEADSKEADDSESSNAANDAWLNLKAMTGEMSRDEAESKMKDRRRNPR